jgi:hypothetical protein
MKQILKLGFVLALVLCVNDALGQAWQPTPKQTTVVSWQSAELPHNLGDVARQYKATPHARIVVRWTLDETGHIRKEWLVYRTEQPALFRNPDIWLYSKPGGRTEEASK